MRSNHAFSLVEVTLAIGVIGFALIAILGLVPVGQNAARDAAEDTRQSLIEQDVFGRIRSQLNSTANFNTPTNVFPAPPASPSYYYTNEGNFFADSNGLSAALSTALRNGTPLPNYAVTVVVGSTFANPLPNVSLTNLKPVAVSLGYPLDSRGNIIGPSVAGVQPNAARKTFTFYVRKP